jgi:hypothetical protein
MKRNLFTAFMNKKHFSARGPAAITCLWLWIMLFAIFLTVDPSILKNIIIPNAYLPVIVMLFAALYLTLWLTSRSKKISFLWSIAIVFFLLLSLFSMGHLVNALLLFGVAVSAHIVIVVEKNKGDEKAS